MIKMAFTKIEKEMMVDLSLNSKNTVEVWVFDIVDNIAIVGNKNFPKESFPVELSRLSLLIPAGALMGRTHGGYGYVKQIIQKSYNNE